MPNTTLQEIANAIVRRAEQQGYVRPRDIRAALADADLPEDDWKEVANLAGESLECRQGRYYHVDACEVRQGAHSQRQIVRDAVRSIIRHHELTNAENDRRQDDRFDVIQPVKVETEEGRAYAMLSRDISTTGIRLLGIHRFLGRKLRVILLQEGIPEKYVFLVRILWTCAVADGLYENGGSFVDVLSEPVEMK